MTTSTTVQTTSTGVGRRPIALIGGALGLFALGALATALVLKAPHQADPADGAAGATPAPLAAAPTTAAPATTTPATPAAPAAVAKAAPKKAQGGSTTSATPLDTQPAVAQVPVCATCGVVEAVTPIVQKGHGSGLGAVAGGVLGGIVGHQMGGGTGKKALTVLGAVGGGLAGNEIEKRQRSTTVYQLKIRMADGSTRTITQAQQLPLGQRVHVDGQHITPTAGDDGAPRAVDTAARST